MIMTQWMSEWVSERTRILLYSSLASFRIRYLCKRRGVCKCVPHRMWRKWCLYRCLCVCVWTRFNAYKFIIIISFKYWEKDRKKKLSINYNTLSRIEIVTCGSARELRRWNCSDRFPVEQLFHRNVQVSINRFSMILCFVIGIFKSISTISLQFGTEWSLSYGVECAQVHCCGGGGASLNC